LPAPPRRIRTVSYTPVWPDGDTKLHPTPFQFTSGRTGANLDQPYERAAFEADLPAVEPTRNVSTGAGCTLHLRFGGGGSTVVRFTNFRNIIANPC
jgi:hypothetical protein